MRTPGRRPWGLAAAFAVGSVLVVLAVVAAKRGMSLEEVNATLDRVYAFVRLHVWEVASLASLGAGIWFSVARRRICLSVLCLVLAFLFSFVFPNF